MTPLEGLAEAMTNKQHVIVGTRWGEFWVGQVLHMTPLTAWMVCNNEDVFVRLNTIDTVETIPLTPEGT